MVRSAHFTTEFGTNVAGGTGTCINELHKASGPDTQIIFLSRDVGHSLTADKVRCAGFYDMDVLNSLEFDVAVFHFYGLGYLADETFLRGRKLIYAVHSVPTTEPWNLLNPYGGANEVPFYFERMCDRADLIVCVSEAERGKLLLLYPDLESKTCVIHNGLSTPSSAGLNVSSRRTTFGFLGRCDYRKGLREAIQVLSSVPGELIIACGQEDDSYQNAAKEDIRRLGLSDRVTWAGRVKGEEKAVFFGKLDALLVPSRWEPFGYVVLEALRTGVPPIVGSRGGMTEIVGGQYRYIFDPWDTESFAECLRTFQNDSEETVRRELETAVRRAERLTAKSMAAEYERLASELVRGERIMEAEAAFLFKRRYWRDTGGGPSSFPFRAAAGRNASSTPPLPHA
ncbi:glycosyltransferase family 4 protein [Paenibacillus alkalitolerans]|uniref:glycosyltransferase family 4 protein n=1 Tax=Paenibacillus alkalitolerans TaxID=2799335 RepID=UPI0018F43EE9|nr:glycosyltransferase family 4 protein [Paenibacillus alkalitolerans]